MTAAAEIVIVALLVLGAAVYLGVKGVRRLVGRETACGSCGSSTGCAATTPSSAEAAAQPQVQPTINLLTPITAADRQA